jgi:hypothetical protein
MKNDRRRGVGQLPTRPTFLILCEGARTEKDYFEAFKVSCAHVEGLGKNTQSLVEEAIRLRDESGPYDHCWCVFDRDSFPPQTFNAALQLARNAGFEVAYSNEAFELWFLLHFSYSDTGLARHLYAEKLSKLLGRPYKKNDSKLYETLLPRQDTAIKNATKLLASYGANHNPEKDNPSTKVHLLVQLLRDAQQR